MIEAQLREIKARIDCAAKKSGRSGAEIELVLVTKQVELPLILEAYNAGNRNFGENRVQDLEAKRLKLAKDIKWHFIGHLQTNKVKQVVGNVELIHSCDRLDLAEAIQKEAEKKGITVPVLIQVNTSGEASKFGFSIDQVEQAVEQIERLKQIRILGLMTIGPLTDDDEKVRMSFKKLSNLRGQLKEKFSSIDWRYLSMGMSSDFEMAIEEGSNLVRIGTAVFGARKK